MSSAALTGRWTRLVVRPDAVLRFWCIGGLKAGPAYAKVVSAPGFEEATFTSHIFLGSGATHVRNDEMEDLHRRFIEATDADPTVPQRLAQHFVSLGEEWVQYCEESLFDRALLDPMGNGALGQRLSKFCSLYSGYAPALYLPFLVERLYVERFPRLLTRIASGLRGSLEASLRESDSWSDYFDRDLVQVASTERIEQIIQPIVEFASRRTNAEQKEEALTELARSLEQELGEDAGAEALDRLSPDLRRRLDEITARFGWIGQWGYPPLYSSNSEAELLEEALVRMRKGIAQKPSSEGEMTSILARILEASSASEEEKRLISDFAYYNFYRTYRMELLIRAQYLSVPLLEVIGDRLGLSAAEWSLLTPVEMEEGLNGDITSATLQERSQQRRRGWFLRTDGLEDERVLIDGEQHAVRSHAFTSVLCKGENAHGGMDSSDPAVVGGKAASLSKMSAAGFPVPDFAVLTTRGVALLEEPDSPSAVAVMRALTEAAASLEGSGRLAVRSSASVEDGEGHSWAGRFDSVLEVELDDLDHAVRQVIASAVSERALSYAQRIGVAEEQIEMAVIAQRLVEADLAGVINTSVPVPGGTGFEIEIVAGLGDKLVAGEVTPSRYLVGSDGAVVSSSENALVSEALLAQLADLGRRLEGLFGRPQDIEFAVAAEQVFVVQSRPLTGPALEPAAPSTTLEDGYTEVVSGLSGYVAERVSSKVIKPKKPSDVRRMEPDSVLVLAAATPVWDSVIFQSRALVTDEGGSTSHAIRVANELGIPAVVGTRIATRALKEGETVVVDTASGTNLGRVLRGTDGS